MKLLQLSAKVGVNLNNVCSWHVGAGQYAGMLLVHFGVSTEADAVLDTTEALLFLEHVKWLSAVELAGCDNELLRRHRRHCNEAERAIFTELAKTEEAQEEEVVDGSSDG